MFIELKESVLLKINKSFTFRGDGILRYPDSLCLSSVDDLLTKNVAEAHGSRYSIHPGSTKMYYELKLIYCWDGM